MNKLVKTEGYSFEHNRKVAFEILQKRFPKIKFSSGNPNVIRGEKPEGWTGRGKIVTAILNHNQVYFNILSTYRGGSFSWPNGITNYLLCKRIARNFNLAKQQIL